MAGHEAQGRTQRWLRHFPALAVTVLGLALIWAALPPSTLPPAPSPSRQGPRVASARGSHVAGRQWLADGLRTLAAKPLAVPAGTPGVARPLTSRGVDVALKSLASSPPPGSVRTEVITYTVQKGDNVWLISQLFNVSQDTVIWANGSLELDPDLLSVGEPLVILPVSGVWHTVKAGETLASIAKRYQVKPEKIAGYAPNGLKEPVQLAPGQKLIVPGGIKPFELHWVYTSTGAVGVNDRPKAGIFIWPCNGAITQLFDKVRHHAIDIGNGAGTPIYAAAAGTVTIAGWYGNMGNTVGINHGVIAGTPFETLYGHMRVILVQPGQYVKQGQQIGQMGSTGWSTGPHTHFIIRRQGVMVNPLPYLPKVK